MITIYYTLSNGSCRSATQWLNDRNIDFKAKRMGEISREDLLHILGLTDGGFTDILKGVNRTQPVLQDKVEYALSLSFNQAVDYVLMYPEVLRTPLIFERNKLSVGFNTEEMRIFVPREKRKVKMSVAMI